VLLAGALPVLSADPLGIDKKIDEGIENITKDPPPDNAADPATSGPRYRDPPAQQRQGPLIPSDLRQDPAPATRAPKFSERFKDLDSYEKAVMAALKRKYPGQFDNPNGDAVRFAKIVIQQEFTSEHEPDSAAENTKAFVDQFMKNRQTAAEARKKASQRVAKRPSALQEVVSDPEVAGETAPDYGEIASTLLSIGGSVAPMMRGARVPSARPAIRAPSPAHVPVRVPAPTIRPPTSSSTITGSDIRLKRDIAEVGLTPGGLHLYRFRYLWSDTVYVGVMAQEVLTQTPAAVIQGDDGYLRVDYGQLGLKFQTFEEWSAATGRHGF
jgi:hypothetical protein